MSVDTAAKARVMIVDDSKLMRKAAQKMLGDEFDIVTAEDGLDAWVQLTRDATIQVMFTDLTMPRSDGYDLLRKVRTAEDTGIQNMPVIVVTGAENDESARVKALDLGATDFITKPFTATDLVARARAHAKYQRITKQLQEQATLDPLTGLVNRAGFLDRLQQDIAFARRHLQPLTIARIDVEEFRAAFLQHGKNVAEGIVMHVARLVRERIRPEDTAARVGLAGFAVAFPAGEEEGIAGMLNRLRDELASQPPLLDGKRVPILVTVAVMSPDVLLGRSAQEELDKCQGLLEAARSAEAERVASLPKAAAAEPQAPAPVAKKAAAKSAPVAAPAPEPAPAAAAATDAAPAAATGAPPILIDPLLDDVAQGNKQAAIKLMPQIVNRLVPLLRLLTPGQRAQVISFLQRLP